MVSGARVEAIVPVSNLERSIEFYGRTVGLGTPESEDIPGNPGARFPIGTGFFTIYESVGAGQSRHTVAGFDVDDIAQAVEELRGRGVTFEEYELPDLKTENGIVAFGELRVAWFKDPDGNIISVGQAAKVKTAV